MKYLLLTTAGLLALVVTVLLASGSFLSDAPSKPAPLAVTEQTEPAELQSTTTASGETFIIDPAVPIEERCTPVTKACLEAQPEWDPTQSAEGVVRITPEEVTLFDGTYELDEQPLQRPGPFTFVSAKDEHAEEYCAQYDLTDYVRPTGPRAYLDVENMPTLCSIYPPEAYQEFLILDENDEILHAYRLTDNHSLLEVKVGVILMGRVESVGPSCCGDDRQTLSLGKFNWDDFGNDFEPIGYLGNVPINPFTGVIAPD